MTSAKAGCTPPTSTAAAAEQLMTQAKRPGPHKRKSVLEAVQLIEDSDGEAHESKRARLAEELEEAAAEQLTDEQASAHQQQQQEQTQALNGRQQQEPASSSQGEAAGAQNGKGKSMLEVVFSPLFNVFNRNNSTAGPAGATAPTASAATETQPEPASAQAQAAAPSEEAAAAAAPHQPVVSQAATDAAAAAAAHTHHAHHPPPPEVPETAESESVDDDDGMELEFDPLLFIRSLPPLEQCIPKHRTALLPRKTRQCKQKTLVLDLDETLVHSSVEAQIPGAPPPDFTLNVSVNHIHHTIHVRRRPHLAEFMQAVAGLFEVVVFTASQKPYAEQLLNILDPKRCLVKHRVFRDSCVIVDGNYLKDLTILGRDMATTCIVDNSPHAFGFQPDNGIPIESWFDDAGDSELLKLLPFLQQLAADEVQDVRPLIAKKFRLKELIAKLPPVA